MVNPMALLSDQLLTRAEEDADATVYEAIGADGNLTPLTRGQLACRASALANELAAAPEGPALLLYPAGLEYAVAIFGGFLAGRPVIPAFPPGQTSMPDRERLAGMIADARPSVVLAPERYPGIPVPTLLAVPGAEADGTAWCRPSAAGPRDVAIIQYTSGSTGRPRGVLVRHESLAANTAAIEQRLGLDPDSHGLTWLPPFHDMGLIGGLLIPVSVGLPARIMSPESFLKSPLSWLREISKGGITVSGGPDFAYDLCVRRARDDRSLEGLDLSSWRVAFSGGEMVRQRTLAAFTARFAPVGFDPRAFAPCYGLAEATLIVTAGHWPGPSDAAAVSCGTPVAGQRVVVVDPDLAVPCADGQEGEIWVAGPHVTSGYLTGDAADLFGELGQEPFLRTGDCGYLQGEELFVTGRVKDVIVFRGVNYHATDIETAALDAAGRAVGNAAAFLVDDGAEPVPVLVLEVRGQLDSQLAAAVRAAVLARTRLLLGLVVLVPPRSVPRTSSGKVRRSGCRAALLGGAYDSAVADDQDRFAALADLGARSAAVSELTGLICGIVVGVCGVASCLPADSFADKGVDSVHAAEAAMILEDAVGLPVPLDAVLGARTSRTAGEALVARWLAEGEPVRAVRDRVILVAGGGHADRGVRA
jgi:acyl-CoA synthetase (AMP-forming)/AMP-acid ligase II